jgi:Fe-S cluster assembly protein SufD
MSLQEIIKTDFNRYKELAGADPLLALREEAYTEFEKLGFPTTRHEEWKYTSLKAIAEKEFKAAVPAVSGAEAFIRESVFSKLQASLLVFVNGMYVAELSKVIETGAQVFAGNLAAGYAKHEAVFASHFGKYAKVQGEAMNALNTALLSDGAFVYVPAGRKAEYPVVILNITDASAHNVLAQPRNLFVIEENAAAVVVEAYYSIGTNASFTNAVTESYAGAGASLEHYKIQQQGGESYQNNYTQIFQERNTNINHVTLTLDGTLVRNNLHFYMNGENCNSLLYGLYVTDGKDFVDNHTRVDHAMPNCFSDEKYKGVLKDQSTAIFNGKILVHLDAQKTNAYQRNQNILLSEEATVNTKPQLEIFADDVKCTHGATIGQLEEEQLFYLRSRGIPESVARKILLNAFADDIAEKIKIPELVTLLESEIDRKL